MATIRPFRAIRPAAEYAEKVLSLPYDVMNRREAEHMAEGNPYSFLHISRSEIDLPDKSDPYGQEVYQKAAENIKSFMREKILIQDEKPCLYLYREIMSGRAQTGIFGCVSVDEYLDDTIKKHEKTRVEKEQDRINHFDVCNADTEPVFLTYRDRPELKKVFNDWAEAHKPQYDIKTEEGIEHILWRIDDDRTINAICNGFKDISSLYIADGHHRSASACKVGVKRRNETPGYNGDEEFNFFMAAVFPDDELKIFDYNRAVEDLNGYSTKEFIASIEKAGFKVEEMGRRIARPNRKHVIGMFLDRKWYRLTADESIIPKGIIESLDVSLLQDKILSPILNIDDPRTNRRIDFIGGIRGLEELERRGNRDMRVAFAVYPVDIEDLLKVSDEGMVMPPKSTWFEPKLGSGLLIHSLDK